MPGSTKQLALTTQQELTTFAGLPSLTCEQQQKAAERIQKLMVQGISSDQTIALVTEGLRASHSDERIVVRSEDEDE